MMDGENLEEKTEDDSPKSEEACNQSASCASALDIKSSSSKSSENHVDAEASSIVEDDDELKEKVEFKVVFNKQKYDVCFPLDDTVSKLKEHIQTLISVPPAMQKLMFKGLAKDDKTLRELGVVKGAKLMVVGSTLTDVLAVSSTPTKEQLRAETVAASVKEPLCKQKLHKKVLDKGMPEDVMPGLINKKDSLPPFPISGMVNKAGGKVRLTFKLELDQVWIGTKERTEKLPMNSIKNVISEPIDGHTEYHIIGLQLGTTEASRYWIYWVPAQYVDAIKDAILGKWQNF